MEALQFQWLLSDFLSVFLPDKYETPRRQFKNPPGLWILKGKNYKFEDWEIFPGKYSKHKNANAGNHKTSNTMNLTEIEKEIRRILTHTERWQQQGYAPSIEKGIVLDRLQKVYDLMLEEPVKTEPEVPATTVKWEGPAADAPTEDPAAEVIPEKTEDSAGEADAAPEEEKPAEDITQAGGEDKNAGFTIFGVEIPDDLRDEFVNELFRNDEDFFTAEIAKLEAMDSLDDALIYIGEEYSWSPDNESAGNFIDMLVTKLS